MKAIAKPLVRTVWRLLAALALCTAWPVLAQNTPAAEAEADIDETAQASLYWQLGNLTAALPLYERLAKQTPKSALFAERFAYCLLTQSSLQPPGKQRMATRARAKQEAERAKALGDTSPLLQTVFEWLADPDTVKNRMEARMAAAEAAFTKGDLDTALAAYQDIAATDPTSYDARLFAGDVYFLKGDTRQAGEWFQKAIDLSPNRETAYRYWGDALAKAGQSEEALAKFVDAVVAEPYSRSAWLGLGQWAQRTGMVIKPPHIEVPPAPTLKGKKNVSIAMTEDSLKNPAAASAWLAYSARRVGWLTGDFAKTFPNDKKYRHSLAEECDALRTAVHFLEDAKPSEGDLDANLRTLLALGKAGMFEPYVLLHAADEGIAQDYDAYRNEHREVLQTYIKEHVLQRAETPSDDAAKK